MTHERAKLKSELRELWVELQQEQLSNHDRSLPFGDGVGDRWQRARLLGFGRNASVYDSALILGNVSVGDESWIGPNTVLDGSGGLKIGSHCSISAGAQIYSHNAVARATSGGEADIVRQATVIGDRCYIGPGAVVEMGVYIGDGCVVGAFSLVRESLPAGSKAWGQPCRIQE